MKTRYVKEHAMESSYVRQTDGTVIFFAKKVKLQQNGQTSKTMPNQGKSNW